MELFAVILKYTGSIVAGVYGIYATLTDFKDQRNGRKVLSSKGYLGIALLVVSTLLSVSSDAFKDIREHRQAEIDYNKREELLANERVTGESLHAQLQQLASISEDLGSAKTELNKSTAAIQKNFKTTTDVLHETVRILDPFTTDLKVSLELDLPPHQPPVRAYLRRVGSVIGSAEYPGPFDGGESFPDSRRPDERALADMISSLWVHISVSKAEDFNFHHAGGSLNIWGYCYKREFDKSNPETSVLPLVKLSLYTHGPIRQTVRKNCP